MTKTTPKLLALLLLCMIVLMVVQSRNTQPDTPIASAVPKKAQATPAFVSAPAPEAFHPRVVTLADVSVEQERIDAPAMRPAITQPVRSGPSLPVVKSFDGKPDGFDARLKAKLESRQKDPAIIQAAEAQSAAFLAAMKDEETVQGKPARHAY